MRSRHQNDSGTLAGETSPVQPRASRHHRKKTREVPVNGADRKRMRPLSGSITSTFISCSIRSLFRTKKSCWGDSFSGAIIRRSIRKLCWSTTRNRALSRGDSDLLKMAGSTFLQFISRMRIESPRFVMIMVLCLVVYSITEGQFRNTLAMKNTTIRDQYKKPTRKPSAKWLYFLFRRVRQIDEIVDNRRICRILNYTPELGDIIHLLGPPVENITHSKINAECRKDPLFP